MLSSSTLGPSWLLGTALKFLPLRNRSLPAPVILGSEVCFCRFQLCWLCHSSFPQTIPVWAAPATLSPGTHVQVGWVRPGGRGGCQMVATRLRGGGSGCGRGAGHWAAAPHAFSICSLSLGECIIKKKKRKEKN